MVKAAFQLLSWTLLVLSVQAQGARQARIEVDGTGLYFVSASEMARVMDARYLDPATLAVFHGGRQIPSRVRGGRDGRLDAVDGIIFYSPGPVSPRSKRATFILKQSSVPLRIKEDRNPGDPGTSKFGPVRLILEEDTMDVAIATVRQDVIRAPDLPDHWYWKRLAAPSQYNPEDSAASFSLPLHPEPRPGSPAILQLDVLGAIVDGVKQQVSVNINGRSIGSLTWTTGLRSSLKIKIPPGLMRRNNIIRLRNISADVTYTEPDNELGKNRRTHIFLDRAIITFPTLLVGPQDSDEQLLYRLPRARERGDQAVQFTSFSSSRFRLYDVSKGSFISSHVVPLDKAFDKTVVCVGSTGFKRITALIPLRRTEAHLPGAGADYVIVTTTRLRPFLARLVDHRRATGLTPVIVEARELYDTFTHGRFSPDAVKEFVKQAHRNWKLKPRFLLLVGDADRDVDWISTKETIPAALLQTDYNGVTASDTPFGDLDGDGLAEVAVGRLPVRTKDDLIRIVNRIVDLETRPDPGPWRRRLSFVAGEARFGAAVDTLLENTLKSVLRKDIPESYRVSFTYGNPRSAYFWPAPAFAGEIVRQFNEGALTFTYIGHGSTLAFDAIRARGALFPIMSVGHVRQIDAGRRNPVLTIIACWTGEYDRPQQDCIGELLLRKSGGPSAVIASSRVSHPFPDALLGRALAKEFFIPGQRLGIALRKAKAQMVESGSSASLATLAARPFLSRAISAKTLIADHLYLYNLLGDPAMRIPLPEQPITLEAPATVAPGGTCLVKVCVPGGTSGRVLISVDRRTGILPWKSVPKADGGTPEGDTRIRQRHREANNPAIVSAVLNLVGKAGEVALVIPAAARADRYLIRAYLESKDGDGIASRPLVVK